MACRWLGVLLLSAACVIGCGDDGGGDPRGTGGTAGGGGEGGVGGDGGSGGAAGGSVPACMTSVLCRACPAEELCGTNDDCTVGSVCIESGCDGLVDGSPIKQCVFAGGGACSSNMPCTDDSRECMAVPEEGMRCIRTAPGCDTSFDCAPGFSCESGSCVDRRVPCDLDEHCPKNHTCGGTANSSFCLRIQRDCLFDFDCSELAPRCVDIDGDGSTECAGTFDPNQPSSEACVNSLCTDSSAPVCEASDAGSATSCGQYGLCSITTVCADGFSCADLWPDGRSECVPSGGDCASIGDCPVREVCASPRDGGVATCQAGFQP